jgi:hypothetical protein
MEYSIKQQVQKKPGGHWYSWSVWIDAKKDDLAKVLNVQYRLHPTFQDAIRTVDTRQNGFKLESSGWGEFNIHATLRLKGGKRVELDHWLEFYPRGAAGSKEAVPKRIFISSSSADAEWTNMLVGELQRKGIRIVRPTSTPGLPWEEDMRIKLGAADVVLAIRSEDESPWVEREVEWAEAFKIPNISVKIGKPALGKSSMRPEMVPGEFTIQTKGQVGRVAEGIVEKVFSITPPAEGKSQL